MTMNLLFGGSFPCLLDSICVPKQNKEGVYWLKVISGVCFIVKTIFLTAKRELMTMNLLFGGSFPCLLDGICVPKQGRGVLSHRGEVCLVLGFILSWDFLLYFEN